MNRANQANVEAMRINAGKREPTKLGRIGMVTCESRWAILIVREPRVSGVEFEEMASSGKVSCFSECRVTKLKEDAQVNVCWR